jgi:hypothetical protein
LFLSSAKVLHAPPLPARQMPGTNERGYASEFFKVSGHFFSQQVIYSPLKCFQSLALLKNCSLSHSGMLFIYSEFHKK